MKAPHQHIAESSPTISPSQSSASLMQKKNEGSFLSGSRPFVQAKLSIGNVEDKYEREADNAAHHIAHNMMSGNTGSRPEISTINEKEKIQRKTEGNGVVLPSVIFDEKLNASQQSGEPLPENLKEMLQNSFGFSLSKIKIHADDYANDLNQELDSKALAFAYNNHIYFKKGKYRPDEINGIVLLAHEITHVIQQNKVEKLEEPKRESIISISEENKKSIKPDPKQKLSTKVKKQGKKHHKKSESEKKFENASEESISELEKSAKKGSPRTPEEDPNFIKVVGKAKKQAKKTKKHDPAEKKKNEMQAAVKLPSNEIESQAKSKQVEKLSEQKPAKFNADAFKQSLMEKVNKTTPKNLEEASDFKNNNKIEEVKQAVSGKVGEEKEKAAQDIQETNTEKPNTESISARPDKSLPPSGVGVANTNIGAKKASPPKRLPEEISLKKGSDSLDNEMKEGDISEKQVKDSNEPTFNSALKEKNEAQKDAQNAPITFRQDEKTLISKAETDANKVATGDLMEMHNSRKTEFGGVEQKQVASKTEEEKIREQIAKDLEKIYGETQKLVEDRLAKLTTDVTTKFDDGAKKARERFEKEADDKMTAYKRRRYSGFWGGARWLKDKLAGMPNEVNKFYEDGRKNYLADMDTVITEISNHVATELNAATQDIATGRKAVQDYFNSLDEDKKRIGQSTLDETMGKFDDLESKVEDKQGELIDSLADKYKENLKQLDDRIEAMKEANKGLVAKAIGAIKKMIKTILELKELLFSVLAKAIKALGYIVMHPIAFLGNLISAVMQGVKNFAKNILTHLQKGFLKWLTGAAGDVQIEIPDNLEPKGIFKMVFSVLGISVENFLARAAKKIPAPILAGLKQTQTVISIVMEKGIIGLWEYIKDQAESLFASTKNMVFEFMQTKIIEAGIDFILKMLTPAGAFIKACQAIYKIIKFIWENAKRIMMFINGILDAILDIAKGNLGNAIKKVENSLADAIPLAIGFLAGLLNLDGIPKKISEILKRLKGRIDAIIDSVINKAWEIGKNLVGKAIAGGKAVVKAVFNWWKSIVGFSTKDGEKHKLFFKPNGKRHDLFVASTPQNYDDFIATLTISATHADHDVLVKDKTKAKEIAKKIDEQILESEKDGKDRSEDIEKLQQELGPLTAKLMTADKQTKNISYRKSSNPIFAGLTGGGFGKGARIEYLSEKTTGTRADGKGNKIYDTLNQRKNGNGSFYVQGHILSEKLHGTGSDWENLTPLDRSANSNHESKVESKLKEVVGKGRVFMYVVTPTYGRGKNTALIDKIAKSNDSAQDKKIKEDIVTAEQYVPTSLVCTIQEIDPTTRKEIKGSIDTKETIQNDISGDVADYQVVAGKISPIEVNSALPQELKDVFNIDDATVLEIIKNRSYENIGHLIRKVPVLTEQQVKGLYDKDKISFK